MNCQYGMGRELACLSRFNMSNFGNEIELFLSIGKLLDGINIVFKCLYIQLGTSTDAIRSPTCVEN